MSFNSKPYTYTGLLLFLVAAIMSAGFLHPDEHFQILEFANYKLGGTGSQNLTWEYQEQMRPTFQVWIAYSLCKYMKFFHCFNPFIAAMVLRLITGLLMWLVLEQFAQRFKSELKTNSGSKWFIVLLFLTWFIPFIAVRFSSEVFSTIGFTAALLIYFRKKSSRKTTLGYALVGFMMALAFIVRYQAGFMIFGLVAWMLFIKKEKLATLLKIFSGFMIGVGIGILSDHWFYGEWTSTAYNYFFQNLIANKASEFGTSPVWYYALQTPLLVFPLFGLVIIPCIIIFCIQNPRHSFVWIMVPFLLVHHIIGHKELRFMIPMIPFVIFAIVATMEKITWIRKMKWALYPFLVINCLALIIRTILPADDQNGLYRAIYKNYRNHWIVYADKDKYNLLINDEPNKTHRDLNQEFYMPPTFLKQKYTTEEDLDIILFHRNQATIIISRKQHYETHLKAHLEKLDLQPKVVFETYHHHLEFMNFNEWMYNENMGWWVLIAVDYQHKSQL